jgi:hypothetical protein
VLLHRTQLFKAALEALLFSLLELQFVKPITPRKGKNEREKKSDARNVGIAF